MLAEFNRNLAGQFWQRLEVGPLIQGVTLKRITRYGKFSRNLSRVLHEHRIALVVWQSESPLEKVDA